MLAERAGGRRGLSHTSAAATVGSGGGGGIVTLSNGGKEEGEADRYDGVVSFGCLRFVDDHLDLRRGKVTTYAEVLGAGRALPRAGGSSPAWSKTGGSRAGDALPAVRAPRSRPGRKQEAHRKGGKPA